MSTFIKTGFWEKAQQGFKGWLDLDQLINQVAGVGSTWGSITGNISDQTDLQTELDDKASISDVPLSTTVTIPSASVLTANSSPYELIAAPGNDKYIGIMGAFISIDYAGTPYATNTNTFIRIGTTSIAGGAITINNTADKAAAFPMAVTNSIPINQNVNFFVQSGNPTAGNSDIKVTIFYKIFDI
jgi:hypothetical protein